MSATAGRLGYLDWMRGLAVLIMIHTHSFFSWVAPEYRKTPYFAWTLRIAGYPAALFLFLAGLALALGSEGARRRGEDGRAIVRRGLLRGVEVLGYAYLFRLWLYATSGFAVVTDLFRVDVLNCIAVSLLLVAAGTLGWQTPHGRAAAGLILGIAIALLTPLAWDGPWASYLPVGLQGYLSGRAPAGIFPVFPWAAHAAFGAAAGVLLSLARRGDRETALVLGLGVVGLVAMPAGLASDRLVRAAYAHPDFWWTSPSFLLFKLGVVLVTVAVAYVWNLVPGWSPLRQMGRTSLLIYWVHIEIVYGIWITPGARGRLDLVEATVGVVLLVLAMLGLSILRTSGWPWKVGGAVTAKA